MPSSDTTADAAVGSAGRTLKASLLLGTGVFEGREDSPGVGIAMFGGSGVFEGREDSPDILAVVAMVHEVETTRGGTSAGFRVRPSY